MDQGIKNVVESNDSQANWIVLDEVSENENVVNFEPVVESFQSDIVEPVPVSESISVESVTATVQSVKSALQVIESVLSNSDSNLSKPVDWSNVETVQKIVSNVRSAENESQNVFVNPVPSTSKGKTSAMTGIANKFVATKRKQVEDHNEMEPVEVRQMQKRTRIEIFEEPSSDEGDITEEEDEGEENEVIAEIAKDMAAAIIGEHLTAQDAKEAEARLQGEENKELVNTILQYWARQANVIAGGEPDKEYIITPSDVIQVLKRAKGSEHLTPTALEEKRRSTASRFLHVCDLMREYKLQAKVFCQLNKIGEFFELLNAKEGMILLCKRTRATEIQINNLLAWLIESLVYATENKKLPMSLDFSIAIRFFVDLDRLHLVDYGLVEGKIALLQYMGASWAPFCVLRRFCKGFRQIRIEEARNRFTADRGRAHRVRTLKRLQKHIYYMIAALEYLNSRKVLRRDYVNDIKTEIYGAKTASGRVRNSRFFVKIWKRTLLPQLRKKGWNEWTSSEECGFVGLSNSSFEADFTASFDTSIFPARQLDTWHAITRLERRIRNGQVFPTVGCQKGKLD